MVGGGGGGGGLRLSVGSRQRVMAARFEPVARDRPSDRRDLKKCGFHRGLSVQWCTLFEQEKKTAWICLEQICGYREVPGQDRANTFKTYVMARQ